MRIVFELGTYDMQTLSRMSQTCRSAKAMFSPFLSEEVILQVCPLHHSTPYFVNPYYMAKTWQGFPTSYLLRLTLLLCPCYMPLDPSPATTHAVAQLLQQAASLDYIRIVGSPPTRHHPCAVFRDILVLVEYLHDLLWDLYDLTSFHEETSIQCGDHYHVMRGPLGYFQLSVKTGKVFNILSDSAFPAIHRFLKIEYKVFRHIPPQLPQSLPTVSIIPRRTRRSRATIERQSISKSILQDVAKILKFLSEH